MTPQTVNAYYNPLANEIVFPAAILQPPFFDMNGGRCRQLRRDRRRDRPRDQPWLRRPGPQVRRQGRVARLVDRRRQRAIRGNGPTKLVQQYSAFSPLPGTERQRRADAGREHRRLVRTRGGAQGLPDRARRQAGAGDRRFHRRPALLPRLGAGLGAQVPRGRVAQAAADGSAQPRASTAPMASCATCRPSRPAFDVKAGDKLYLPPDQRVRIW